MGTVQICVGFVIGLACKSRVSAKTRKYKGRTYIFTGLKQNKGIGHVSSGIAAMSWKCNKSFLQTLLRKAPTFGPAHLTRMKGGIEVCLIQFKFPALASHWNHELRA